MTVQCVSGLGAVGGCPRWHWAGGAGGLPELPGSYRLVLASPSLNTVSWKAGSCAKAMLGV